MFFSQKHPMTFFKNDGQKKRQSNNVILLLNSNFQCLISSPTHSRNENINIIINLGTDQYKQQRQVNFILSNRNLNPTVHSAIGQSAQIISPTFIL